MRERTRNATRFDWPGLVTVVGGLSTLSLGLLQGQQWGGLAAHPRAAHRRHGAARRVRGIETATRADGAAALLRNARFSAACAGWFGAMFAFISVFFFLPVYLEWCASTRAEGLARALPGPFRRPVRARIDAGGTAVRRGRRRADGHPHRGDGRAADVPRDDGMGVRAAVLLALFTGVGFGAAVPTLTRLAMSALDERDAGVGAGVFNTVRQIAACWRSPRSAPLRSA
jgi:hypothetical protein